MIEVADGQKRLSVPDAAGLLAGMSSRKLARGSDRPVIYQLLVRTFGNTNETRKYRGTLAENGCGKFDDITSPALTSLRDLGITHLWLTGVLEHASGTSWPGRPADDPDIVKGVAGSPYAVRDYFDVCPDLATNPELRLEEFKALLGRCRDHGLKVLIDFVPNHVARSYGSDVRPDLSFGEGDDSGEFFTSDNHFYYLRPEHPGGGPPLKLPDMGQPGADGWFEPEAVTGRVTGNNVVSWQPAAHDWYETVKLNYGHDFTTGGRTSYLPGPAAGIDEVPRTWRTMDEILGYWQEMGVHGFRVDMAHMVPMEFWHWIVRRCRSRDSKVFFVAEAYGNDDNRLTRDNVLDELLCAGFDAVYDDPVYGVVKGLYESGKWANDLDPLTFTGRRFHHSLRYVENHDEVRIANPGHWGGHGMKVGKPATAVMFSMGRGPVMIYHGQEVGEPAIGAQGFSGDDGRTSIFDYTSLPELCKWVNDGKYDGGRLSDEQKALRGWYGKLLRVIGHRAFTAGQFYGLNHANKENPAYGRVSGEYPSGHWLYSFLRRDTKSCQAFLVVANFHPTEALNDVRIIIPRDAWMFLGRTGDEVWSFTDHLDTDWAATVERDLLETGGVSLPNLPPCSAMLLEIDGARCD